MKTNDTKYTEEFVLEALQTMLDELRKDKDIIYLWELFEDKDYTRFRFHEWIKKYHKNRDITRISHTIKEILETRAVKWALKNKLNWPFTMFHLKNNYKWKDKTEIQQDTTVKEAWKTKEELEAELKELEEREKQM